MGASVVVLQEKLSSMTLAVLFVTQISANDLDKTPEDGQSVWAPESYLEDLEEAPSFGVAQLWPLWPYSQ